MSNDIGAAEEKVQEICSSSLDLKADSETDRPPRHIISKAIPADQADALGEIKVGAGVELETCAEGTEVVEPQDIPLIPEII